MQRRYSLVSLILLLPTILFSQWQERSSGTKSSLSGIYFFDTLRGWIVYPDSCLLTTDSGSSWQKTTITSGGRQFYDVAFVTKDDGVATSYDGRIFRSFNGGRTWSPVDTKTGSITYFGISALQDFGLHLWIVGTFEKIAYSSNYGSDWTEQHSGSFALNDVFFVNKDSGWAVGNKGTILHTSNGGRNNSWSNQSSNTSVNLLGVWFYDSKMGWAVGDSGRVLKTENGGQTWQLQQSKTTNNLRRVSFSDKNNGAVVGVSGTTLHTKDGGRTWLNESGIVNTVLSDVFYVNLENCWAIGQNGKLLFSQGSIIVRSPNGGEKWEGGKEQTISWESNYLKEVQIEFYDGVKWNPISSATDAPAGSFRWTPPVDIDSTNCKIRMTGVTKSGVKDESDQVFTIYKPDNTPPKIQPPPLSLIGTQGKDILISAIITDESQIKEASLYFQLAGKGAFNTNPAAGMTKALNDTFKAKIPWSTGQDDSLLRGFEFYIEAFDASFKMNRAASPVQFVSIQVVSYSRPITASTPERPRYQMISIPLEFNANDGSIDSILVDDFGPYDLQKPINWRLFRWLTRGKKNGEFLVDPIGQFKPGIAFWLVSRKAGFDITTGKSVPAQDFDKIVLEPKLTNDPLDGWNQIGHPFAFTVSWASVTLSGGTASDISEPYHRNAEKDSFERANVLLPWEGYFVKNRSTKPITLKIPAKESSAVLAKSKYPFLISNADTEWSLQLLVGCKDYRDGDNFLGVQMSSANEWDKLDQPEPPTIGEYISLYFPHLDWEKYPDHYTTDFRSPFEDGQVWDFVVTTNIPNAKAEIIFNGIKSIPNEFDVYLVDERLSLSQNLRQDAVYSFPTASRTLKKQLKIAVGKSEFFQQNQLLINQIPLQYELSQNFPNPFNPVTSIRFGLPVASAVTLKVYNVIGEEVAALLDHEPKQAGYHLQVWNGLDKRGQPVPSGVYFYRINAGAFSATKKMLFIK